MCHVRLSYTRELVASNICGYFDLVSNMLPRIESCSISGNILLGCLQQVTSCMKALSFAQMLLLGPLLKQNAAFERK